MFNGNPVPEASSAVISGVLFWPDLYVAEFQRARAVPADVHEDNQIAALMNAATAISERLEQQVAKWQAEGIANANEVPGFNVHERSWASMAFQTAVFARAKALLLAEFGSIAQRSEANNAHSLASETREALMAESESYVNRLLGISGVRVTFL
ncbi:head completion/stabilization protein [Ferrimonas senticii]|uniref:head completion/stabilization protein n=1 Tax=Ferrimonas senticii TaxID=394566 RepID=UPI00041A065A|nr:head completion/stabilization protein [Ferrimonas senticii]